MRSDRVAASRPPGAIHGAAALACGLVAAAFPVSADAWRVDPTFGVGGLAQVRSSLASSSGATPYLDDRSDNRIAILFRDNGNNQGTGIVELTSDGSVAAELSDKAPYQLHGIVGDAEPSGRFVLLSAWKPPVSERVVLARLSPNGLIDPSFGSGGLAGDPKLGRFPTHASLGSDGLLLSTAKEPREGVYVNGEVRRFTLDGKPDLLFGQRGVALTGAIAPECFTSQPDRRIVLGTGNKLLALTAQGVADSTFGRSGVVTLPAGSAYRVIGGRRCVVQLPDRRLVVLQAGRGPDYGPGRAVLLSARGAVLSTRGLNYTPRALGVYDNRVIVQESSSGDQSARYNILDFDLRPKAAAGPGGAATHPAGGRLPPPALQADGSLTVVARTAAQRLDVVRLRPDTGPVGARAPTAKPKVKIGRITTRRDTVTKRVWVRPTVTFSCGSGCPVAVVTARYVNVSRPNRSVYRSGAFTALSGQRFQIKPNAPGGPRLLLQRGRYRVRVSATDAFGRVARTSRLFAVR